MNGLVLNSGGIDSPVAAYLMAAHNLTAVHFDISPYADNTAEIAKKVIEKLNKIIKKEIPLFVVPHGNVLSEFLQKCKKEGRKYTCVFCKRMMLRTAERIAHTIGCDFVVTGENLGQVASQTLYNIYVTSRAIDLPVVRPLIGLDKLDIISIAERIGTYDISTERATTCTIVPHYPAIRAQLSKVEAIEKCMDMEGLITNALNNMISV